MIRGVSFCFNWFSSSSLNISLVKPIIQKIIDFSVTVFNMICSIIQNFKGVFQKNNSTNISRLVVALDMEKEVQALLLAKKLEKFLYIDCHSKNLGPDIYGLHASLLSYATTSTIETSIDINEKVSKKYNQSMHYDSSIKESFNKTMNEKGDICKFVAFLRECSQKGKMENLLPFISVIEEIRAFIPKVLSINKL